MIDVLLPFYGDPGLLREAVHSVLAQTSHRWRLVVVDDAYPDPEVVAWFAALDDPRVEYHRNIVNLGANANYSRALSLARADHVVMMGADDVMHPNYVRVIEDALDRVPQAHVVQCGVRIIDGQGIEISPLVDRVKARLRPRSSHVMALEGDLLLKSLLTGNWTYFPSLCWRREVIDRLGFRPQFHVVQDLALLVDVVAAGGVMALAPEIAFAYRRHGASDSAVKTVSGSRFDEERAFFGSAAEDLARRGHRRGSRAARLHLTSRLHAAALLPAVLARGQLTDARRLIEHAVR